MIFRDRVVNDPAIEGCEQRQGSRGIGVFDFDIPQLDQQWLAIGADPLAKAIGSIQKSLRLKLDVPERARAEDHAILGHDLPIQAASRQFEPRISRLVLHQDFSALKLHARRKLVDDGRHIRPIAVSNIIGEDSTEAGCDQEQDEGNRQNGSNKETQAQRLCHAPSPASV